MKPLFVSLFLMFCMAGAASAQADTIYTLKNEKIVCKVYEIGQIEIKYKKIENPDGPLYTILRERVRMILYANGYQEMIIPDEMEVHKEEPIMDKRSVVKFEMFSPMFDMIAIGYERVWKPGINLEAKLGFINNSMFPFSFENGGDVSGHNNLIQGGSGKVGIKLLLGSHTYTPGSRYRHPLHGGYVSFSVGQSVFTQRGLAFYVPYYYPNPPTNPVYTDLQVGSTSFSVNYGHQFVLANTLTLGLSIGVGYGVTYSKYSNPEVYDIIKTYPYWHEHEANIEMLYTHVNPWGNRAPIAINGSFTLGYILK